MSCIALQYTSKQRINQGNWREKGFLQQQQPAEKKLFNGVFFLDSVLTYLIQSVRMVHNQDKRYAVLHSVKG